MTFVRTIIWLLLLLPVAAQAHSSRVSSANPSGLSIAGLSHGEMSVLSAYRSEIHDLAARQNFTNPTFRTLLNYSAIQFTMCLWGMAPGMVSDEESPFNECAHAYLSADKALLLHMRDMPSHSADVSALVSRIDADMTRRGAAFIGCQYSGGVFNTAEFVTPHWENLPRHWPTLSVLGAFALALASPFLMMIPRQIRKTS